MGPGQARSFCLFHSADNRGGRMAERERSGAGYKVVIVDAPEPGMRGVYTPNPGLTIEVGPGESERARRVFPPQSIVRFVKETIRYHRGKGVHIPHCESDND